MEVMKMMYILILCLHIMTNVRSSAASGMVLRHAQYSTPADKTEKVYPSTEKGYIYVNSEDPGVVVVVPYWGSPSERKILRQFWERKDLHTRQAAFHVVITSYQIVVSDLKYLNRVSWQYMILDEAQAIKSSAQFECIYF